MKNLKTGIFGVTELSAKAVQSDTNVVKVLQPINLNDARLREQRLRNH